MEFINLIYNLRRVLIYGTSVIVALVSMVICVNRVGTGVGFGAPEIVFILSIVIPLIYTVISESKRGACRG